MNGYQLNKHSRLRPLLHRAGGHSRPSDTCVIGGAFLLATVLTASPAIAQTLVGRVLEEHREVPVGGAVVTLLDAEGEERASAIADSLGRYRLAPPEAGEYVVRAVRLGYEASASPRFAMGVEGEVPLDLLLRPLPVGLEGFEVTVDRPEEMAESLLRRIGLRPEELGQRWISREDLEKAPISYHLGSIILSQSIPGVSVLPEGLCLQFRRVKVSGRGFDECARVVVDGAMVSLETAVVYADLFSRDDVEAIAVLTPVEATTLLGTQGGAGAVFIWTRRGGAR